MTIALPTAPTILRGQQFADAVREALHPPASPRPLPDLKHRRIVIPGMVGGELMWATMGFIAHALQLRGAEALCLSCDSMLPACTLRRVDHTESACTRWCHKNARLFAEAFGLPHRWYSEYLTPQERDRCAAIARKVPLNEIHEFEYDGMLIGPELALSAVAYFKVGRYNPDDPAHAAVIRQLLEAGLMMIHVSRRVFDEFKPDKVMVEGGRYINWGMMRALANQRGIPVDIIEIGVFGNSLRYATDRGDHLSVCMPQWQQWRSMPLTAAQETSLDELIARRDVRPYEVPGESWSSRTTDPQAIRRLLGLQPRPAGLVFSMFPNVGFDAVRTKTGAAYEYVTDWIIDTIEFFRDHPAHVLLLKVHPAELHRQALDPTTQRLSDLYGRLPDNIRLIEPRTPISAQGVLRISDVAMIYTSTVAAEAAALNVPLINTGGGWHAGRGISSDCRSRREYLQLLEDLCCGQRSPTPPGELGRRYAYSMFVRADIPVRQFQLFDFHVRELTIDSAEDLLPGREAALDNLCRGILCDEPVHHPDA